jgi:hypothetical protein
VGLLKWRLAPFFERVVGLPSYRLELIRRHTPFASEYTCMVFWENGNLVLNEAKKITNNRNKAGNTRMDKWIHRIWIWVNQLLKNSDSVEKIKLFDFFGWCCILTFCTRIVIFFTFCRCRRRTFQLAGSQTLFQTPGFTGMPSCLFAFLLCNACLLNQKIIFCWFEVK